MYIIDLLVDDGHKYGDYKVRELKNLGSNQYQCTNKNYQSSNYVDNDVTKVLVCA